MLARADQNTTHDWIMSDNSNEYISQVLHHLVADGALKRMRYLVTKLPLSLRLTTTRGPASADSRGAAYYARVRRLKGMRHWRRGAQARTAQPQQPARPHMHIYMDMFYLGKIT